MTTNPKKTTDFTGFFTPEQAAPIFEQATRNSVVQTLAKKVPLGTTGKSFPVVTTKPTAKWTGEGEAGHKTELGLGLKTMKPAKITAIFTVTEELLRENPAEYATLMKDQAAEAFGKAFDLASLHGKGMSGGSSPFETYLAQTSKSVELGTSANGIYGDLVAGLDLLLKAKKRGNGFVFDETAETMFLEQLDANKRPIFVPEHLADAFNPLTKGRLIGRNFAMGPELTDSATNVLGFLGDWTKAVWGVVGGITIRISRDATVKLGGELVSTFDNDLVAIKASAEYGWLCVDTDAFTKFTNAN